MTSAQTALVFPPYRKGHETQRLAAETIAPKAPTLREAVYSYVEAQGDRGSTIEEASNALGLKLQTTCARIRELQGFPRDKYPIRVVDSGLRRPTASGSSAKVWRAVR